MRTSVRSTVVNLPKLAHSGAMGERYKRVRNSYILFRGEGNLLENLCEDLLLIKKSEG